MPVQAGAPLVLDEPTPSMPPNPSGTYTVAVDTSRSGSTKPAYSNGNLATFTVGTTTPPPTSAPSPSPGQPRGRRHRQGRRPISSSPAPAWSTSRSSRAARSTPAAPSRRRTPERRLQPRHDQALAERRATFTAHAWNTPPGDGSFTSDADAGSLRSPWPTAAVRWRQPAVGGGTRVLRPRSAPLPHPVGGTNFVLVKNWDFGADGTIRCYADMDTHFQYHDQFGTIDNGGNYGAVAVASSAATALSGQPIEDAAHPARQFLADSLKTFLTPLDNSGTRCRASTTPAAARSRPSGPCPTAARASARTSCGRRACATSRPRTSGSPSGSRQPVGQGAEFDIVESFGYDNGGGVHQLRRPLLALELRPRHRRQVPPTPTGAPTCRKWASRRSTPPSGTPGRCSTRPTTLRLLLRRQARAERVELQLDAAAPAARGRRST